MRRTTTPTETELEALARRVGIPTRETAWLEQALTHRSYTRERGEEERESNERLEFLGDAIAQLAVSLELYERYPRWSEGQLTRARAAIVSREPMFQAALRLDLGRYLRLGKTECDLGGRARLSILASAFESVVAAVYLTSGMEAASRFTLSALAESLDHVAFGGETLDAKTRLQEKAQATRRLTPAYRVIDVSGPAHDRVFTSEVLLGEDVLGAGTGRSKKDAEQAAAERGLETLESGTRRVE